MSTTNKVQPQELKPARTVPLAIYIRDLALTVLITAALAGVGSYFGTLGLHSQARQNVVADMAVVKKTQAQPESKTNQ